MIKKREKVGKKRIKKMVKKQKKVMFCENCEREPVKHKGEWCDNCNLPERSMI